MFEVVLLRNTRLCEGCSIFAVRLSVPNGLFGMSHDNQKATQRFALKTLLGL